MQTLPCVEPSVATGQAHGLPQVRLQTHFNARGLDVLAGNVLALRELNDSTHPSVDMEQKVAVKIGGGDSATRLGRGQ